MIKKYADGRECAILGLGVSNLPLAEYLAENGIPLHIYDKSDAEAFGETGQRLASLGARFYKCDGDFYGGRGELIFRSPGIRPDRIRPMSDSAELTSEMELFLKLTPTRTFAVTGSDGKTTTTTLISEMLKASGKTVWLGGNIGTPLLPLVRQMRETDYAVVELSSFQLMDMKRSPARAVVTNLAPNHLDIHKDMEEYVQAKTNIFRYQDEKGLLVLNADNAITAGFRGNGAIRFFSRQGEADVCVRDGVICRHGQKVLPVSDILIPGVHNVENYMAAIAVVEGLVEDETIRQVAKTFGGVEHRIALVRVKDGGRFYNDSIASSPSRTIAGLRSFPEKVILIAGGYDKHIPYDVLGPEICAHVSKLFLGGATGGKIRQAVLACPEYDPAQLEIVDCGSFEPAVRAAAAAAKTGDVVLMSPASAAFDQFKNFMVRGDFYKKLVKEL